nr:MAG TPA: hypothetical protein [Caudoviricetes sp.]
MVVFGKRIICSIEINKRNQKPDEKDNRQTNESIINFFHFAFSFPLLYLHYIIFNGKCQ